MKNLQISADKIVLRQTLGSTFGIWIVFFLALLVVTSFSEVEETLAIILGVVTTLSGVMAALAFWEHRQAYVIDAYGIEGRFSWLVKERIPWRDVSQVVLCAIPMGRGTLPAIGFEMHYGMKHYAVPYSAFSTNVADSLVLRDAIDRLAGKEVTKDCSDQVLPEYSDGSFMQKASGAVLIFILVGFLASVIIFL